MTIYEKTIPSQADIFKIIPKANLPSLNSHAKSMEPLLKKMLSKTVFEKALTSPSEKNIQSCFSKLNNLLPIIDYENLHSDECFSLFILCNGIYAHGIEKFITDIINKWLFSGKPPEIIGNRSLNFNLAYKPDIQFYFLEYYISIPGNNLIKNNIDQFINHLKINILAVQHSRLILSEKQFSLEDIKENISPLLKTESKTASYNQMENFLLTLSKEKTLSQVKENLNKLMNKYPVSFNNDIYESINYITALFKNHFTAIRSPEFISKVISYHYLFNKTIKQKMISGSNKRHLYIKIIKAFSFNDPRPKQILGILISVNILQDTERFEQKHFLQAIKNCIPDIKQIKNSFVSDKREQNIICYYLEIEKKENENFSLKEIKELKKKLPAEIKIKIENILNPIFMPHNEEEILRNIILLNKQIKYVRDIPQAIISYDKQTGVEISFMIILIRLIKPKTLSLKEYFSYSQTFLKYIPEETKIIGSLKKKYPKELNIFKVSLKKSAFYRKDYSLDLQKARQAVVSELIKVIGDFRDYNGGMIHKHTQALKEFKNQLPDLGENKEFLAENFFYSIKPGVMKSILETNILKTLFLLFLQILEQRINPNNNFSLKTLSMPKYVFIMIGAYSASFKEPLEHHINKLKIPSSNLTSCFIQEEGISTLGYIYKTHDLSQHSDFYRMILNIMNNWSLKN